MSKEHPILFTTSNVIAIQEGKKTMTRRIIKPQPIIDEDSGSVFDGKHRQQYDIHNWKDRFIDDWSRWMPEDLLWVRETWKYFEGFGGYGFKASCGGKTLKEDFPGFKWKPSIFMPRKAARIFLEVTNISIERLQDISEEDAITEGIQQLLQSRSQLSENGFLYRDYSKKPELFNDGLKAYDSYKSLWQKINGEGSWDENKFVWVITFKNRKS